MTYDIEPNPTDTTGPSNIYKCKDCDASVDPRRWDLGKQYRYCLDCGEARAANERESWCVLTPHKQGGMFFTAESALSMAKGINNKGGLIK
jgi:hypothetical protein